MVTAMTASRLLKNSSYLLCALFLAACQPSPLNNEPETSENSAKEDTPVIITADSVTMTTDHILSIKSSRYQPSLGLQGNIEPIKQTEFISAHPLHVKEILVAKGQWVEKGTPLLIVRRLSNGLDVKNTVSDLSNTSDAVPLESDNPEEKKLTSDIEIKSETKAIKAKNTQEKNISLKSSQPNIDSENSTTENVQTNISELSAETLIETSASNNTADSPIDNQAANSENMDIGYELVTVRASFAGRIEKLYVKENQNLEAHTPLLKFSDETKLHFIATVPVQAESQLSVGQTVNFTAENILDKFTGQVSKLTVTKQPKRLLVNVDVIKDKTSHDVLLPGTKVTGRVNYGQIDVGTIVPKRALHDVDLTELQTPPYKPLVPLTANIWIIGQDQRLKRQPIEVVEYNPSTEQYLIAGTSNDSLICLADLPADSDGKQVNIS